MKYKCTKSFLVSETDADGFDVGKLIEIKVGEIYERDENDFIFADAHLIHENGSWIEITYADLNEFFKEIE